MECPYCGTRNLPGTIVCNQCGAILREIKRARPAPKERASGGGGGIAGAARALFGGNKVRGQLAALQTRLQTTLEKLESGAQESVKGGTATAQIRLNLGASHLLKDEIERAVQEFQFAQKAGATGTEFANNTGVALARRGHLTQAMDLLPRAAQEVSSSPSPQNAPAHANMAHALSRLYNGTNPDVLTQALREAQQASIQDPKNPVYQNRMGLILCQQELYADAIAAFGYALQTSEGTPAAQADALNNLGVAHALCGDLATASVQFRNALLQEPGHARALSNEALLLSSQGDFEAALEQGLRAARLDPRSALVRNNNGYALSRILAINEGIREFKEATLLDTHLMEPLYNQAKSYADEHINDFAERYITRAGQLAPRSWQVLLLLGVIKLNQGQYAQAIPTFQAARKLRPQEVMVLTNLGLALALNDNDAIAESTFQQASRLAPQDYEINLHLGWLYLRQGQTSASTAELAIALEQNDNHAIAHNNYGLCEVEMTNPQEALRHFRRALQIDPHLSPVHYQLGCAYALMNDIPAAIQEWEQNVKAEAGNADASCNLGVAYYKAGKMDQAVTQFRHVITVRHNRMEDYSNLGLAYAKQGVALKAAAKKADDPRLKEAMEKHKLAIEMFDRALAIVPSNVMLHSNRGLACFFANRPEEAMQEWGHVSRLDPGYARRRGQKQQTEFDESQVNFVPLHPRERAIRLPAKTPDYLARYAFSYDTDEWELVLSDAALVPLPALRHQARQLERAANLH